MPTSYQDAISNSGLTIYDEIMIGDPELWIPTPDLERILNDGLTGLDLSGLALRTRSKVVKQQVTGALGYPVPSGFKKTQPRFVGQQLDIYVQKSNNLQVWNEELSPTRRYAIIRVGDNDIVSKVKVITGEDLSLLDTTGTLTQKFQARLITSGEDTELVTPVDTSCLSDHVATGAKPRSDVSPTEHPKHRELMPIKELYRHLEGAVGMSFADAGKDQERNRGAALHGIVCKQLGYSSYKDDGRFPDVRHQLLEVKLQTSPTIDLGLVCPDSDAPLDVPMIEGTQVRHMDVRYAIFYAVTDDVTVTLTKFYLTTGEGFFGRFPQFGGKVLNKKLQIPLPSAFFD